MIDGALSSQSSARRLSGFSFGRQWRLTRKELAESLRDRRTIITLLLMPILVYPLLGVLFRQFLVVSLSGTHTEALLGIDELTPGDPFPQKLQQWLQTGHSILESEPDLVDPPLVKEPEVATVRLILGNAEQLLREQRVDLAVKRLRGDDPENAGAGIELIYPNNSPLAASLRSFVERRIRAMNLKAMQQQGLPTAEVSGLALKHRQLDLKLPNARPLLPTVVPLILLLMTITGAVYPAIDLTAGERERGTLEALIAAPVSRFGVLLAKYVAVLTVALLTATMNLAAMSLTIYSTGLANLLIQPGQSVVGLTVQVFGLLLLFASFFSAVLLAVTSFAKSFKEAQAYLIPLMLVTLAPGLMSLSPTLELTGSLAVTPLINVVLLARDVFSGDVDAATTLVVVTSTALYAAVSIALAARIFGSDAILYGSGGTWTDLFRRPVQQLRAPTVSAALFVLALVFAALINVGGSGSLLAAESRPGAQLVVNAVLTGFVFAGIPLLAAMLEHVRLRDAFRLQISRPSPWLASVLLGLSLGVLVSELTILGLQLEITTLNETLRAAIEEKAAELSALPLSLVIVCLAIVPAIAEELFFRGYLFSALVGRWGSCQTVLATSIGFAAFHTFGVSGLTIERLLPSLLLGLALGLVAWRSGSVLPGMLLHMLNNSLLLVVANKKDELIAAGWLSDSTEHLPGLWLGVAGGLAAVGLALLGFTRQSK